jgi:hypothetical protein
VREGKIMNIQIKDHWDGTQSLLLDDETILSHRTKAEVEQKANVLRMAILFKGVDKVSPTE